MTVSSTAKDRPWLMQRRRWLLLLIIVLTAGALALTLALFLRALPAALQAAETVPVSLEYDGAMRTIETNAATVGELLAQERIAPPPNSAISPAATAPLQAGLRIRIQSPRAVLLVENGEERIFETVLENPWQILQSAGVTVSSADKIWVNGALAYLSALPDWTVPAQDIKIRRAAELTILDDGKASTLMTTAETVGEALFAAGITLYLSDAVSPPLDSAISEALTIEIKRALPLELVVDGVVIEARSKAARVAEALDELNAPLFGLDYVRPPGDTPLQPNMTIEIVRVTEEILSETETIAYETRFQADAAMPLDQRAVLQAGKAGRREIRQRLRYENGIEVSREAGEIIELEAPQDQIIAYGTQIETRSINTPAGPREYWRVLCMLATSYHPGSVGGSTTTAIGATLAKGIVAADPKIIPYRSQVYVAEYGIGTMADTAGYRSSPYWIDLGYSDADWQNWRRYVPVYLLTPLPANIDYLLPTWTANRSYPGSCN